MKRAINVFITNLLTVILLAVVGILLWFISVIANPGEGKLMLLQDKILNLKVRNLTRGGCGHLAYAVTDYLDSAKVEYHIVRLDDDNSEIPHHVMVNIAYQDVYIDGLGFFNHNYTRVFGNMSIISKDSLRVLINKPGWNKKFKLKDTAIIKQKLVYDGTY